MRGAASGGRSGRQPEYQQRPRAGGQSGGVAVAQMALMEWQSYFWDVMLASRVGVGKPLFLHPVGRDLLHRLHVLQFMFRSSALFTPT